MDVLKAVEVGGGCTEALEVDVKRLGGNEVGTARSGELKMGLDGAVADGALNVGGEGHVATKSGVAAEEEKTGLAEGDVPPLPRRLKERRRVRRLDQECLRFGGCLCRWR